MAGNKISGGKVNRSHSTAIDAAIPIVRAAQKFPEVSKISLGIIKQIGKGLPNLKFTPINGGIKLVIRGSVCLQEIFVYTHDPRETERKIARDFNGK